MSVLRSILLCCVFASLTPTVSANTIARTWNEQNLSAIRTAFPDPPVHARNLFHLSAALYDAWAAFDTTAIGYAHNETGVIPSGGSAATARHEAMSYAAYRVLVKRYFISPHPNTPASSATNAKASFDAQMANLGYDTTFTATTGDSPAALGNRIAASVLDFASTDQSREEQGYNDPTYASVNSPLAISLSSGNTMADPNRWQPLAFQFQVTQNGIIFPPNSVQSFVGSHWGAVRPFSLHYDDGTELYYDPGAPPYLNGIGDTEFKQNNIEVIRFSSWLDPDDNVMLDYSPGSIGNNTLGQNDGTGHAINPITLAPYASNLINRADFGRVLAEFWADGPDSETPPGHWNTLANEVVEHPDFEPRLGGPTGPLLDDLEWDTKMYFALNGALHDAAVAVWGCKRFYDYVRPISSIRYLGTQNEFPLTPGLVEIITPTSAASGERHEHLASSIGKTAIYAWAGEPIDPSTQYSGSAWILAEQWLPYQRDTFVTPAFAGYVSGHSAFSRAAAEILTEMTGSEFFPGGFASHTVLAGDLEFELGPSTDVTLQWATYYDAADQAGISRLYGGIHVAPDDGPGRIVGSKCGLGAWNLAQKYYDGSIASEELPVHITKLTNGSLEVTWPQHRGMFYRIESGLHPAIFPQSSNFIKAENDQGNYLQLNPENAPGYGFFRVVRSATGL